MPLIKLNKKLKGSLVKARATDMRNGTTYYSKPDMCPVNQINQAVVDSSPFKNREELDEYFNFFKVLERDGRLFTHKTD